MALGGCEAVARKAVTPKRKSSAVGIFMLVTTVVAAGCLCWVGAVLWHEFLNGSDSDKHETVCTVVTSTAERPGIGAVTVAYEIEGRVRTKTFYAVGDGAQDFADQHEVGSEHPCYFEVGKPEDVWLDDGSGAGGKFYLKWSFAVPAAYAAVWTLLALCVAIHRCLRCPRNRSSRDEEAISLHHLAPESPSSPEVMMTAFNRPCPGSPVAGGYDELPTEDDVCT